MLSLMWSAKEECIPIYLHCLSMLYAGQQVTKLLRKSDVLNT